MKKRILALVLCLTTALTLLTGCGSTGDSSTIPTEIPAQAQKDVVKYLTNKKLKSDTVVMTVGEQEITASYYLYWMAYYMSQMNSYYSYYGQTFDLTAEVTEGVTMAQYIQNLADDAAIGYAALEQKAAEYDVALSDEEQTAMQSYVDGQEEETMLYFCTTPEDQGKVYTQYQLGTKLQTTLYNDDGALAPTEETLQSYAEDNGFYTCRYILCQVPQGSDDETAEEMKEKCQGFYDELKELDDDERLERFIELQTSENADGNTQEYTFSDSDSLVSGFREKLAEMKAGELGMTDQTDYGYFTLLRLDTDMDIVKESYVSSDFSTQMSTWSDEAETVKAKAYDKIDAQAFCENLVNLQAIIDASHQAEAQADSSAAAEGTDPADGTDSADGSVSSAS